MLEPCNLNRSFPAHYCIVTNGFFMILLGEKAGMINTTNYYRYRNKQKNSFINRGLSVLNHW